MDEMVPYEKKWFGKSGVYANGLSYCLCTNAHPEWDSNHETYSSWWTAQKTISND